MRPSRPGLRKVDRVPLVRARTVEVLTREAEERLFLHVERMTEARLDESGYEGCTMLTVDLRALSRALRGEREDALGARLLPLVEASPRVRLRALRLALAEAGQRTSGRSLGTARTATTMRVVGTALHIDVDVSLPFVLPATEAAR